MKIILTGQTRSDAKRKWEIIVDDSDFERLSKYNWSCNNYGYATIRDENDKTILMHRMIMQPDKGFEVDHINHNKLDNRRENLRVVSRSQNNMNQKPQNIAKSSKYKGVSWSKKRRKWEVHVKLNYRRFYLGHYGSEIEAAKVYDNKAKELFGDFAYLNLA